MRYAVKIPFYVHPQVPQAKVICIFTIAGDGDTFAFVLATFLFLSRASHVFASKVPYMVVPGNHEAECHSPSCLASPRRLNVSKQQHACMK